MKGAQEAGLTARREPPTHEVLGGRVTSLEARSLFPKQITKHGKSLVNAIAQLTTEKPIQFAAKAEQEDWKRKYQALMDQVCADTGDKVGRRVDLQVFDTEEEAGQERLVDTSVTHLQTKPTTEKPTKTLNSASATASDSSPTRRPNRHLPPQPYYSEPRTRLTRTARSWLSPKSNSTTVSGSQTPSLFRPSPPPTEN